MKATRYAERLNKGLFWLTSLALLLALVLPSDGTGVVQASPLTVTLRPNAAGYYQEWTPFGDTVHWQLTSDQSDTTGVQVTGYITLKETENLADTTQTGTINSVTAYMRALAIGSGGVEKAVIVWRTYSTDYESPAITIGRTAFTSYSQEIITNPNTDQAWTWTEVNALEIGSRALLLRETETIQVSEYWVVVNYTPFSTAIEIRAQDYLTPVTAITFPEASPGATVSTPYNDADGSGSPQAFGGVGTAKPVVTLYSSVTYIIWYNIATFTNGIVASEKYLINTKGAACDNADAITNAVNFDADTSTGITIAAGAGNEKDLYLKITLSAVAGKSGTSTLTILGEAT